VLICRFSWPPGRNAGSGAPPVIGALNAFMVSRLNFPPRFQRDSRCPVTVSRNHRRLTRGMRASQASRRGLFLGQGYVGGIVPAWLFILIAAIAGFWWWLHVSRAHGRSLCSGIFWPAGSRLRRNSHCQRLALLLDAVGFAFRVSPGDCICDILGRQKVGRGHRLRANSDHSHRGAQAVLRSLSSRRTRCWGQCWSLFAIVILQR